MAHWELSSVHFNVHSKMWQTRRPQAIPVSHIAHFAPYNWGGNGKFYHKSLNYCQFRQTMLKYNYQRGRWTEMTAEIGYRTHYKQSFGIVIKKRQTRG